MIVLLLVEVGLADSTEPYSTGFVVGGRTDAPTDAIVPFGANWAGNATASVDGGAPTHLAADGIVHGTSGNPPVVGLLPPAGGWPAGSTVEITAPADDDDDPPWTLTFTVGGGAAARVAAPKQVGDPVVGAWSDDQGYAWGCCKPVRTVTFDVESGSGDPWAYVQIRGVFLGPSQLSTSGPEITHLDAGFGPGTHALSYEQWQEGGLTNPPCFEVLAVSASGEESRAREICVDVDGKVTRGGCDTSTAGAGWLAALALGAIRRRRS